MDNWVTFFVKYFPDPQAAEVFVARCEALTLADANHKAKIMMHQTQRLVSIADELPQIRPKRESLQLLFLLICAEHISKVHDGFTEEGQSKKYVKRFFIEFLSTDDKSKLGTGFIDNTIIPMTILGFEKAVDLLYGVRCEVVHEGKYWGFSFHDGNTSIVNVEPGVTVHITFLEFRDIIVKGCINAIKDKLKP